MKTTMKTTLGEARLHTTSAVTGLTLLPGTCMRPAYFNTGSPVVTQRDAKKRAFLAQDTVEQIWDKQDASGLVWCLVLESFWQHLDVLRLFGAWFWHHVLLLKCCLYSDCVLQLWCGVSSNSWRPWLVGWRPSPIAIWLALLAGSLQVH